MQKTIRRDKTLQKELDKYLETTDMPLEHAIAVVGGKILQDKIARAKSSKDPVFENFSIEELHKKGYISDDMKRSKK